MITVFDKWFRMFDAWSTSTTWNQLWYGFSSILLRTSRMKLVRSLREMPEEHSRLSCGQDGVKLR